MTQEEIQKLRDLPLSPEGSLMQRLGITFSHGRFLCPAHADHSPSATVSRSGTHWKCWSCGAGGNAIDLTMMVLNKSFSEACKWLSNSENIFIGERCFQSSPSQEGCRVLFDPMRYARLFEHPWLNEAARRFLFETRQLDPRVISWCRISSWIDRNGVPWLQIPYYDADGRLIGVQNRNLSPTRPRFLYPPQSRISIYNLPMLRYLKPGDECWIAEGCSDAWSHMSDHHKVIAIASATLLQSHDKELLRDVTTRLQIRWKMAPDTDEPGRRLSAQLKEILPMLEIVALPQGLKDYSDYYLWRNRTID